MRRSGRLVCTDAARARRRKRKSRARSRAHLWKNGGRVELLGWSSSDAVTAINYIYLPYVGNLDLTI